MANTKVPVELSSTPSIVDNGNATAITIDSSENVQIGSNSFATPRLQLYAANTGESQIFFGNDGTNGFKDGAIRYFHESHATTSDRRNMTFSTANTERMRINATGVGIGTTSPNGLISISSGAGTKATIETTRNFTVNRNFQIAVDEYAEGTFTITPSTTLGGSSYTTPIITATAAGRVGIGTTSPVKELQIGSATASVDANMFLAAGSNAYSRLYMGDATTGTGLYAGLLMYDHGNDAMTMFTSSSERMRIDSVGETTIKRAGSGGSGVLKALNLNHAGTSVNDGAKISFTAGASTEGAGIASTGQALNSADLRFYAGGNTERMRINSSGSAFFGVTSEPTGSIGGSAFVVDSVDRMNLILATTSTGNVDVANFRNPNGTVGKINTNGSSTVYNTSSDARLKDVTGSARGLEVINELNPVSYNWKVDGKADEGLIAQEVLDIIPNAVSGSEEEQYYMDYSKLVVHLVKGMKEQQELINNLTARIEQLEN